jgi:hexosaminidase
VIKRNLDAMSGRNEYFHWHLVDDQGWRIEIKKHKVLTDKSSDGAIYTQKKLKVL